MQDSWLYGMSLRKNRSKALPVNSRICGLDGINDQISIDNSGTPGSPFDWETTSTFTWAIQFTFFSVKTQNYFFTKQSAASGYYSYYDSGTKMFYLMYRYTSGTVQNFGMALLFTPTLGTPYILVFINKGLNVINNNIGIAIYNATTGAFITNAVTHAGGTPFAGSIKNTQIVSFGNNITGIVTKITSWNAAMSDPQVTDLVTRMVNNTIEGHSLYSSNCVGYWREYLPKIKLINAKDQTYNGTPVNF
jgi:hypothetical protein